MFLGGVFLSTATIKFSQSLPSVPTLSNSLRVFRQVASPRTSTQFMLFSTAALVVGARDESKGAIGNGTFGMGSTVPTVRGFRRRFPRMECLTKPPKEEAKIIRAPPMLHRIPFIVPQFYKISNAPSSLSVVALFSRKIYRKIGDIFTPVQNIHFAFQPRHRL